MARTISNMLPLGTVAPSFLLTDTVSGKTLSLDEITANQPFVLMFICNHCPFVIHLHEGLQHLISDYKTESIQFIAINSNDVERYPEDKPELMTTLFHKLGFGFPYLFDENQEVAKAYDAACTPDFYVFNKNKELTYRGEFDPSRPDNGIEVTGVSIRKAIKGTLEGKAIDENQKPSLGCGIKWR
jgi:thiol-disulfide isomerase/thioredoxin